MTDSSTLVIKSPTRISRRSRSRQKQREASPANGPISQPSELTASPNKSQIQRVYTTDCAGRSVGGSAREHRLNAMRRRKSLPVQLQMPSSYFESLQFDDDDDDDEDGGITTHQRSNTWAQRKTALRKRSKSPMSPKNPSSPKNATRSRRPSGRKNNSDDQSQSDIVPQKCRWTNEANQKKETTQETSCRWQSSPSRRRSSSSSPLPPLRGVREHGDRMVNPATQTASSPRLPKRKVSHSNDDPARPTIPSPFRQTHMGGPPSLETKGDSGNTLETLKMKMQVMQTHDTKSYRPQRNHAESA